MIKRLLIYFISDNTQEYEALFTTTQYLAIAVIIGFD